MTDADHFAEGKNVEVTVTYSSFTNADSSCSIPYNLLWLSTSDSYSKKISSGGTVTFTGNSDGTVSENLIYPQEDDKGIVYKYYTVDNLMVRVKSEDWGKAAAGDYTATITFSSQIVTE